MGAPIVLLDACVLYPAALRDLEILMVRGLTKTVELLVEFRQDL